MMRTKYIILIVIVFAIIIIPIVLFVVHKTVRSNWRNPRKLMIDHDAGTDDAVAIFMALLSEEYLDGPELVALSTTHGNGAEDQVFINTQRILDIAQRRDVPIYRGFNHSLVHEKESDFFFGKDGLGDSDYHDVFPPIADQGVYAAIALINLSKQYKDVLEVLTIGSLTNIALALKLDPEFIQRLSHLYVAAGNIEGDPEFNAIADAEAYHIVAKSAVSNKVTFIPFSSLNATKEHATKEWRENVLGKIDTKIMRALNSFEKLTIDYSENWDMLDPTAMALILNSSVIQKASYSLNGIVLCGSYQGVNTNIFDTDINNSKVVQEVNAEVYKELLMQIFSSEL